ncbi:peptide MFS transporter [Pedobacter sp. V48]|uniref:peptide MFS transporter n=1 Tax=Pedobacter sp. V48 TaxID=509635 RepID=UPI0003E47858|nr:peptide MFS transporter [Pedobacter sp. V48]ETZ21017.1 amino acid transporter [Pedobacter sp. V48]
MQHNITLEEIQDFKGKYPKQLWALFLVEMWERFCFYGMRGMLTIFMIDKIVGLALTDKDANLQYAAIQAFVYAFTFLGGIFADKVLGFRKSLFFGGMIMILGNLIIAVSPKEFFYIGITLSIIGTGFFKPNVSSMVGDLYKEGDARRDAGYGMFYAGINIGGLLGGALCVYLGKYVSWNYAFLAAAIVMALGLITFLFTQRTLGPIGDSPLKNMAVSKKRAREIGVYLFSLISVPLILIMVQNTHYTDYFMYTIAPLSIIYFLYETYKVKDRKFQMKLFAAFIFIFCYFLFNAIYEQSGGSLALFAEKNLSHTLLFFNIDPNVVNNSSNSLFVIIFSPLIGLLWLWLAKKKMEPNSIIKFGVGFLFLAASFYIFFYTRFFADANGVTSLNLFTLGYLVTTIGELCLGPIGMSLVTQLSPKKLTGMMMGMWFLASAFGQFAAGKLGAEMSVSGDNVSLLTKLESYTSGYYQLAIYAAVAGVFLILFSPLIKRLMQGVS